MDPGGRGGGCDGLPAGFGFGAGVEIVALRAFASAGVGITKECGKMETGSIREQIGQGNSSSPRKPAMVG